MRRLRALSEDECYARCYGSRLGDDVVRIVRTGGPRRRRFLARISGEDLRRLFEDRLDSREPETEAA